eukprot:scaffold131303_cov24-Prasinocladus_malaysianus.AAC.1
MVANHEAEERLTKVTAYDARILESISGYRSGELTRRSPNGNFDGRVDGASLLVSCSTLRKAADRSAASAQHSIDGPYRPTTSAIDKENELAEVGRVGAAGGKASGGALHEKDISAAARMGAEGGRQGEEEGGEVDEPGGECVFTKE